MNLEQRTKALLALVEQYKARRFAELLEPVRVEAREALRSALADGRRRVSTAIAEERKRRTLEVGAVEAALATDRRLAAQRHAVHLLGGAWGDLRARLVARWAAAPTRTQWIESHLRRAARAVPTGTNGWRIEYHPAWSEPERMRQHELLRAQGVAPVQFDEDPGIAAGFRIVGGHNVLDATLEGLLADRTQLEGRLLHHLKDEETP
jgi:hypothetical protein